MIAAIRRLWRAIKREIILGDIVAYQERLDMLCEDGIHKYDAADVMMIRGTIAMLKARLASDEFREVA